MTDEADLQALLLHLRRFCDIADSELAELSRATGRARSALNELRTDDAWGRAEELVDMARRAWMRLRHQVLLRWLEERREHLPTEFARIREFESCPRCKSRGAIRIMGCCDYVEQSPDGVGPIRFISVATACEECNRQDRVRFAVGTLSFPQVPAQQEDDDKKEDAPPGGQGAKR